jgi:N-methylhydantoinase A
MGAAFAAKQAGVTDFVATDMGGTSYDLSLVRGGEPEIKVDWNWHYRYYIGLPMVDVQSVGAGGGSIASVRHGALRVGPESAGASPGPACYGRGGDLPTVTDADLVLGYLPEEGFAGGRMRLDREAAHTAIEREVAKPLGIGGVEAAWGIERIVNANMANETRRILSSHGADPRDLSLIAYGGNGGVHAWAIAAELGLRGYRVPKAAPAFSALGVLVADYRIDLVKAHVAPIAHADPAALRRLIEQAEEEADQDLLRPTGLSRERTRVDLFVQVAYPGQNFDMSVPCPEGDDLDVIGLTQVAARFHDLHEQTRGFAFRDQPPTVRGIRLIAQGMTPKPERTAVLGEVRDAERVRIGTRPAYFGDGFVDTPIYDGPELAAGAEVVGPALIQEPFTVVVVAPGSRARLDALGSYEVSR